MDDVAGQNCSFFFSIWQHCYKSFPFVSLMDILCDSDNWSVFTICLCYLSVLTPRFFSSVLFFIYLFFFPLSTIHLHPDHWQVCGLASSGTTDLISKSGLGTKGKKKKKKSWKVSPSNVKLAVCKSWPRLAITNLLQSCISIPFY